MRQILRKSVATRKLIVIETLIKQKQEFKVSCKKKNLNNLTKIQNKTWLEDFSQPKLQRK